MLRITGRGAIASAKEWFPFGFPSLPNKREVITGEWEWAASSAVEVQVLLFPGPDSATGEDVVELHCPGSPPVVEALLEQLHGAGVSPAPPGEFTRRAFLNGKIDLTQAEAVGDLVGAETADEAREAAKVLSGELGKQVQAARDALSLALVEIEAGLDFEEGDSQDLQPGEVDEHLSRARVALEEGVRVEEKRQIEAAGVRVGLLGLPNAGKSSLFSSLTDKDVLISPEAGTTRDRLEGVWNLRGSGFEEVVLGDGPGLGGVAVDARDAEAQARSKEDSWDVWWLVVDSSDADAQLPSPPEGALVLVVFTKADLPRQVSNSVVDSAESMGGSVWVSSKTGKGYKALAERTSALLEHHATGRTRRLEVLRRHQVALGEALGALERAEQISESGEALDLLAEELRDAGRSLGTLVGDLAPEELLDLVFSRFCIGK